MFERTQVLIQNLFNFREQPYPLFRDALARWFTPEPIYFMFVAVLVRMMPTTPSETLVRKCLNTRIVRKLLRGLR